LIARQNVAGAALLLLASVAVGIGVVRALLALLREPEPEYVGSEVVEEIEATAKPDRDVEEQAREPEPRLAAVIIMGGLVLCLVLLLWPQLHTGVIEQVVENYTFFGALSP
jgi:hypothetical protein